MKIEHIALYVNDLEASRNFLGPHPMTDIAIRKRTSARIFFPSRTALVLSL